MTDTKTADTKTSKTSQQKAYGPAVPPSTEKDLVLKQIVTKKYAVSNEYDCRTVGMFSEREYKRAGELVLQEVPFVAQWKSEMGHDKAWENDLECFLKFVTTKQFSDKNKYTLSYVIEQWIKDVDWNRIDHKNARALNYPVAHVPSANYLVPFLNDLQKTISSQLQWVTVQDLYDVADTMGKKVEKKDNLNKELCLFLTLVRWATVSIVDWMTYQPMGYGVYKIIHQFRSHHRDGNCCLVFSPDDSRIAHVVTTRPVTKGDELQLVLTPRQLQLMDVLAKQPTKSSVSLLLDDIRLYKTVATPFYSGIYPPPSSSSSPNNGVLLPLQQSESLKRFNGYDPTWRSRIRMLAFHLKYTPLVQQLHADMMKWIEEKRELMSTETLFQFMVDMNQLCPQDNKNKDDEKNVASSLVPHDYLHELFTILSFPNRKHFPWLFKYRCSELQDYYAYRTNVNRLNLMVIHDTVRDHLFRDFPQVLKNMRQGMKRRRRIRKAKRVLYEAIAKKDTAAEEKHHLVSVDAKACRGTEGSLSKESASASASSSDTDSDDDDYDTKE